MAGATCKQRVKTLNESGYARYDERTSSMLGDTCETLLDRHGGDLRNLREGAQRGPRQERELLKDLAGKKDSPPARGRPGARGHRRRLRDQFVALSAGRRQPPDEHRHFGLVVDDKHAALNALAGADAEVLPVAARTRAIRGATSCSFSTTATCSSPRRPRSWVIHDPDGASDRTVHAG